MLVKSKSAFRTIAEVAEELGVATYVLRFWETKFKEISPMKATGGRRYYRPDDVMIIKLIRDLLYEKRYTIEGVQKLFKEKGVKSFLGADIQKDFFDKEDTQTEDKADAPSAKTDPLSPILSNKDRIKLCALKENLLSLAERLKSAL